MIAIPLDLVHVPLRLFVSEDDACFTGSPEGARDVRERLVAAPEVKIAKTDAVEATITRVSRGQAVGGARERREDGGRR